MQIQIAKTEYSIIISYDKQVDTIEIMAIVHAILTKFNKKIIKCLISVDIDKITWTRDITSYLRAPLIVLYEKLKGYEAGTRTESTHITEALFTSGLKIEFVLIMGVVEVDLLNMSPTPIKDLLPIMYEDWLQLNNLKTNRKES